MHAALSTIAALALVLAQVDVAEIRSQAEQGDAVAQSRLGSMYSMGLGVPRDDGEAIKWFSLAAEQGEVGAQFYLAEKYDAGEGVPEDDAQALKWYRLAAEQGSPAARQKTGELAKRMAREGERQTGKPQRKSPTD